MKKTIFFLCLALVAASLLFVSAPGAQPYPGSRGSGSYCPYCGGFIGEPNFGGYEPGYGMGPGMMGYGRGYGMGRGMMGYITPYVPEKLPAPKNQDWVKKLRDVLTLEKLSYDQYAADEAKFNAYMPYRMVIPQEEDHIQAITRMFAAYGIPEDAKAGSITDTKTVTEAYQLSIKMERTLIPLYEELIKNAEDNQSADILKGILLQTRYHLTMFEHALSFGGRMGPGMGYGYYGRGPGMGSGMMGGRRYGYGGGMMGYGPGYGWGPGMMRGYGPGSGYYGPSRVPGPGPVDMKEAKSIMQDYVSSMRNPNLKLGKIKDAGTAFEAEILTKKGNALVDRVLIDKQTGLLRSAY